MPIPLTAPMPPGLDLRDGWTIRFNALDPTTGDEVTGVSVNSATVTIVSLTADTPADLQSGPFVLVPGPGE